MVPKRHWFLRKVWKTIRSHNMLDRGERVVVAVSGGGDSVALLVALWHMAPHLDIDLVVAHLNHQLRASAHRDQEFVVDLAKQFGLRVATQSLPPGLLAGSNLEAKARVERYRYLREVAAQFGCTKIATGHTRNDQAETVMLRLLRGSGLRGLRGILPVRADGVIRPLIDCTREEARAFVTELSVGWREDETNFDPRFLRNRVRAMVLPALRAVDATWVQLVARLADRVRNEFAAYEALLEEKLCSAASAPAALDLATTRQMDPAVRRAVIRLWLSRQTEEPPPPSVLDQIDRQMSSGVSVFAPLQGRRSKGYVTQSAGQLVWIRNPGASCFESSEEWGPIVLRPGRACSLPGGWTLFVEPCAMQVEVRQTVGRDQTVALLDADAVQGHLVARACRRGDVVVPLGMTGQRKLQDVFVDRKVPRLQRWGRPAVCDDRAIVWVPGVVRGSHALVTPKTRRTWCLRAVQAGPVRS